MIPMMQRSDSTSTGGRPLAVAVMTILALTLLAGSWRTRGARAASTIQNSVPVTSVSAASYVGQQSPLAPGSIVAAFGTELATGTQVANAQPLPTSLLTTTVTVNGVAAPLFFVSPNQINYLVPTGTTAGDATVTVKSTQTNGDEIVSTGTIRVAATAPAIFTANASGGGAPAGLTGRIDAAGQFAFDPAPPFSADPVNPGLLIPAPIDVGTADRPAFLILYGTGIRNAGAGTVSAVIGGVETGVEYFGAAPGFTGLDQVNLRLPVALKGSGLVAVTIVVDGVASNVITINLAGTPSSTLAISGFSAAAPVVAGETITIDGNGFASLATANTVRFGAAQARVVAASATQLSVIVPFGAESGQVVVQANGAEARSSALFRVRTSISGLVQSTGSLSSDPVALGNVTIRLAGTSTSVRTTPQGTFVLADIPEGVSLLEIDGGTSAASPPYPSVTLKVAVRAERDNQIIQPISLQQINGGSGNVGTTIAGGGGDATTSMAAATSGSSLANLVSRNGGSVQSLPLSLREQIAPQVSSTLITNRGVTLEVPVTTTVKFPDGSTRGTIQVTMIERSRLPGILLPSGVFSSNIVQITPLGVSFSPGASISFPNPDPNSIGPGTRVDIYRYDSGTGGFIKRGTGTISANRLLVVSDGRIVDSGGFWMAAVSGRVTTVTGRLIDSFGDPVAGGKVSANGRAAITDQNGGFSLPDVAAIGGSSIQVEAVLPQQFGTPPRGLSAQTPSTRAGVTDVGTIALSETNQPGLVLSPFALNLNLSSKPTTVNVTLTEPAPLRGLVVSIATSNETVAKVQPTVTIPAGKTTASFTVTPGLPGTSLIEARASLAGTSVEGASMVTVSQPGPVLTSVFPASAAEGSTISVYGTGLATVAIRNYVTFRRNGQLLTYLAPSDIRIIRDNTGQPGLSIRVPKVGPGAVSIQVAVVDNGSGVLSDPSEPINFTVTQKTVPAPRLASVAPAEGAPRDQVTISGSGFSATPKLNMISFVPAGQTGTTPLSYEAEVRQASPSSLLVVVPVTGLPAGKARIIARVMDESGVESSESNVLEFNVLSETIEPPATPTLTRLLNRATGNESGREGDLVTASGANFGRGWYRPDAEAFANNEVITIFRFYQNNRLVNFTFPVSEGNSMSLVTTIPSGLQKGNALVTATNYDPETGKSSDESRQITLLITEGTPLQLREAEPNNTIDQATRVILPSVIEGDISSEESGELIQTLSNGEKVAVTDLYRLSLGARVDAMIDLSFLNDADLDLFIYRQNAQGGFDLLVSSSKVGGEPESIRGTLVSGEYLIGVAARKSKSVYTLRLLGGN